MQIPQNIAAAQLEALSEMSLNSSTVINGVVVIVQNGMLLAPLCSSM